MRIATIYAYFEPDSEDAYFEFDLYKEDKQYILRDANSLTQIYVGVNLPEIEELQSKILETMNPKNWASAVEELSRGL